MTFSNDQHQHRDPLDLGRGGRLEPTLRTAASTRPPTRVDVFAPLDVTGLYMKGTSWTTNFTITWAATAWATPARRPWATPCKPAAQSKTLPWVNINVIEPTFNEPLRTASASASLILSGGTGGIDPAE